MSGVEPSTGREAGAAGTRVNDVDVEFRPVIHATPSLYEITAKGVNGALVHINQDGRVWVTR